MTKIAIVTLGTRGDLQPFIALGVGLKDAGYDVLVISSKNEKTFAESFGLDYYALDVDIQKIMEGQDVQGMTKGDNPLKFFTSHLKGSKSLKQKMVAVQTEIWEACQNADAIICHPGMANAFYMAKELGIPSIMASPFPVTATADYPSILFYNGPRLGKIYNRITHFVFEKMFWQLSKSSSKDFWKNLSKPNVVQKTPPSKLQVSSGMPVLYGYSEHLFQRPKEWQTNIHVTGSWMIKSEPDWIPPTELVNFINAGKPPIYMGFGSIKDTAEFKHKLDILLESVKITKQRAVIALGWNSLETKETLPPNVFLLDNAPHSWLFPQMSGVVHHGGAGTTAAGLYAGKPTIIIPHSADQPAWGRRVYELGVGAEPIPSKKLTSQKLAEAINFVSDEKVIENAAKLGEKLRTENGVDNAVKIINAFFQ